LLAIVGVPPVVRYFHRSGLSFFVMVTNAGNTLSFTTGTKKKPLVFGGFNFAMDMKLQNWERC
jgi:hypothetical protein